MTKNLLGKNTYYSIHVLYRCKRRTTSISIVANTRSVKRIGTVHIIVEARVEMKEICV